MIKAFQNGEDIHASTASKLFDVPLDEVTKTQRSQAKTVNFGILYGQGAFGLAEQTGLSRKEAKEMIESYFETYPKLKKYMADQVLKAKEMGYTLDDLVGPDAKPAGISDKSRAGSVPGPAKYRSKDDPSLTWSGRGRPPRWIKEAQESGIDLETLSVDTEE